MVRLGIFPVFDNIFTDLYSPPPCRGAPLLSQYHNGLFYKKTNMVGGGGFRTYFFESPMEFLGFCFTPKFQTK